ncbi:MAG: glycoside hydrolase family 1 protein [Chloroflexi bacterium]|nr:glycoside hydrolase family 1 protein [Chloroflexota bacterium]
MSGAALRFPEGFLWGSATAAHQVEGNNTNNDWWAAEQAGRVRFRSGDACDQYHRFDQDFALLGQLGQTCHRLSLEWSRIEPRPGELDQAAIAHYRAVLESVRRHGMEPIVTLHHFTNPLWLVERGGWTRPEAVRYFERYARRMAREYQDLVRYWVTINEPGVYASQGWVLGVWPPNRPNDLPGAMRVLRTMALAHGRAYRAMKEVQPDARIGVAHHWRIFDPANPDRRGDRLVAAIRNRLMNMMFPVAIRTGRIVPPAGSGRVIPWLANTEDWIGLNYYTREHDVFDPREARLMFGREMLPDVSRNQLGWEIYPQGLERALLAIAPPSLGREVIITENGIPEPGHQDLLRPSFLVQHLMACHRAIQQGVRLRGYAHWTSLDNFEWAEGFVPRFGLVYVDFATQVRTPKPSAYLYRDIIQRNGLSADEIGRFGNPATVRT